VSSEPGDYLLTHRAPDGVMDRAMRAPVARSAGPTRALALAAVVLMVLGGALGWSLHGWMPSNDAVTLASDVPVRLALKAPGADSVSVAGTFNEWSPVAMATASEDGLFQIVLMLPQGRHEYLFLVDGVEWVVDPQATLLSDDDFGVSNAILDV